MPKISRAKGDTYAADIGEPGVDVPEPDPGSTANRAEQGVAAPSLTDPAGTGRVIREDVEGEPGGESKTEDPTAARSEPGGKSRRAGDETSAADADSGDGPGKLTGTARGQVSKPDSGGSSTTRR